MVGIGQGRIAALERRANMWGKGERSQLVAEWLEETRKAQEARDVVQRKRGAGCCVQLVPNEWVCALGGGGAGRSVALRERRVCAGSPPKKLGV